MSKRTKKVGTAGRYSARYGVRSRAMVRGIENQQRRRHGCPKCGQKAVQRKSTSIWKCSKCGNVFAGGAYHPTTASGLTAKQILKASPVEIPGKEESK
jgi:large subunit ribosomal protein L37Ae